jgi:hypothetical protein
MRRTSSTCRRLVLMGFGVLSAAAAALCTAPAFGQLPEPHIPDIHQRSGLLDRFEPIEPHLPHDKDRDTFYTTRWGDKDQVHRPNNIKNGGLYGRFWKAECTACVYPFFRGSPGRSTLCPDCKRKHFSSRLVRNVFHPFKPVGMYYTGGCYVPIYDLDPLVPGVGPYPYGVFKKEHGGG